MHQGDDNLTGGLPPPHGGVLVDRTLSDNEREKTLGMVSELRKLEVDPGTLKDIDNIASGLFSPLEGFLSQDDYLSVLKDRRLSGGQAWTIPIVLDVAKSSLADAKEGEDIVITDSRSQPIAILHVKDIFKMDRSAHALSVYGTEDKSHPGVARTHEMEDLLVGGKISLLNSTVSNSPYYLPPKETRARFKDRGWKTVVGFQTRNVPHSGHEGLQKAAPTKSSSEFYLPRCGMPGLKRQFITR
jgi:sulfate adenylyltransferase